MKQQDINNIFLKSTDENNSFGGFSIPTKIEWITFGFKVKLI